MTTSHDPPRLRTLKQDLPASLARALETMPAEEASNEQLASLAAKVRAALEAQPAERSQAPRRRTRSASRRVASLVVTFAAGAAAGVAVATGLFLGFERSSPRATAPVASVPGAIAIPRAASASEPHPAPTPAEPPSFSSATVAMSSKPAGSSAASAHALGKPSEAGPEPSQDELALVARAQEALARTPGAALSLVAEHERTFPRGALGQECEVIAIDALLKLGRMTEAEARAGRFHQRFPTSALGRRVDVLLGARN